MRLCMLVVGVAIVGVALYMWGLEGRLSAVTVYTSSGVANGAYDVVAYWSLSPHSDAVRGVAAHSVNYGEVTYYFSSAENAARFEENPESYLPEYGGYCAYAAAQGYLAPVDPDAWTVHGGKLYLNYSKSVRETWLGDIDGYIQAADRNWPELQP